MSGHAQTIDTFSVPIDAVSKFEDIKVLTKLVADPKSVNARIQAEARPKSPVGICCQLSR